MTTRIVGIVNVTRDSFSDGGRFLDPAAALAHARRLLAGGADVIELGAQSTHPDAEIVPAAEELARLEPLIVALKAAGAVVSVDAHRAAVMARALALGADLINDVTGFADAASVAAVRDARARLVVMHARRSRADPDDARAQRLGGDPASIVDAVITYFHERVRALTAAGIERERLVLDPGLGLFLGTDAELSLAVLRELPRIAALGFPVMISASRKSFIGTLLGRRDAERGVAPRGAVRDAGGRGFGTLACELWAAAQGAAFIRTHDAAALRDALTIWEHAGRVP